MWVASLPTGYQDEAKDGLIGGNDSGYRVVANLLRDDSEGSADSASAALGSVARAGNVRGVLRELTGSPGLGQFSPIPAQLNGMPIIGLWRNRS